MNDPGQQERRFELTLSHAEALVLFEWIELLEEDPKFPAPNSAEQLVLWRIAGVLQKQLPDLFADDYAERLATARDRLTTEAGFS